MAHDLLSCCPQQMQINEPERPGVTPITLVVGGTTTYWLWIEQPAGPCARFTLRRDGDGNVFAAIGIGKDEGVCNDYTPE
jgi:hypothetical protein